MSEEQLGRATGEWGNIYTDGTARGHLVDVLDQLARAGVCVMVLYTGHYPACHVDMVREIADHFAGRGTLHVVPFAESMIMDGDHAGASETSFMLYLDRRVVDMTAIREVNYRDHGWEGPRDPMNASVARGEESISQVVACLDAEIRKGLDEVHRRPEVT